MHFHLPKPLHGWREFAGEVGIIVIGVLIALGFEQIVEVLHQRTAAVNARKNVSAEISSNLHVMMQRIETQTCVDRKLSEIGQILSQAGDGIPKPHPSWISRPSFGSLSSGNWQAATAAGGAALLSKDDQIKLGGFFAIFDFLNREQEREQAAWARLRGLEDWNGPLGGTARFGFVQALQDARYSDYRIEVAMRILLRSASEDGILIPKTKMRHSWAICLPITTPRKMAERAHVSPLGDPF